MDIMHSLKELRKDSGIRLNKVATSYIQDHGQPYKLVDPVRISNANWKVKPKNGIQSLANPVNLHSARKVKILGPGKEQIINILNKALLGGENYPVLTTVLGIAGGMVSGFGSILFSVGTTAISINNQVRQVLARFGDEIWHVEEIGKVGNKAMYVSCYFIVDPYRAQTPNKGWLIDETRIELDLN